MSIMPLRGEVLAKNWTFSPGIRNSFQESLNRRFCVLRHWQRRDKVIRRLQNAVFKEDLSGKIVNSLLFSGALYIVEVVEDMTIWEA